MSGVVMRVGKCEATRGNLRLPNWWSPLLPAASR